MSRQKAVQRLFVLWVIGAAALALFVTSQVVGGKYGEDDVAAFSWLVGIAIPPLSILAAAVFVDPRANWRDAAANLFKFRVAFWISIGMLILAFGTLLLEPLIARSSYELFANTGVVFGLVEGLVVAALGAVVFDRR